MESADIKFFAGVPSPFFSVDYFFLIRSLSCFASLTPIIDTNAVYTICKTNVLNEALINRNVILFIWYYAMEENKH